MSELPEYQPAAPVEPPDASRTIPAWLEADPCPQWCDRDHPEDEHPEDRPAIYIPVVAATTPPYRGGAPAPAEYLVTIRRYAGRSDTWVYVGDGEDTTRAIEITVESARRLVAAAMGLIGQVQP